MHRSPPRCAQLRPSVMPKPPSSRPACFPARVTSPVPRPRWTRCWKNPFPRKTPVPSHSAPSWTIRSAPIQRSPPRTPRTWTPSADCSTPQRVPTTWANTTRRRRNIRTSCASTRPIPPPAAGWSKSRLPRAVMENPLTTSPVRNCSAKWTASGNSRHPPPSISPGSIPARPLWWRTPCR